MRTIVVDDELSALNDMMSEIKKVESQSEVYLFINPEDAITFVEKEFGEGRTIDIAFLDIEMYGMNGIELSKKLKGIMPHIYIIFVTGYSNYAIEAFSVHARGYLLKPVMTKDVEREIKSIELEYRPSVASNKIFVSTFGNFEIFKNEKPVKIRRAKSKEILAYLVDRKGAMISSREVIETVYDGLSITKSIQSQYRNMIIELLIDLKAAGCENIIIRSGKEIAVDRTKIVCDYYEFLAGNLEAINSYTGEYMNNYSWAEITAGNLTFLENAAKEKPVFI